MSSRHSDSHRDSDGGAPGEPSGNELDRTVPQDRNLDANRPLGAPDFALSHHEFSLRSQGALATFNDPDSALAALRSGACDYLVGALPFDLREPWALTAPRTVWSGPGPLEPPAFYRNKALPEFSLLVSDPGVLRHRQRVAAALSALHSGRLEKVVLARREFYQAAEAFDPRTLAAKLMAAGPDGYGFLADLSPAGPAFTGHHLVGASPELLVRRNGRRVTSFPLAGSAARELEPDRDRIVRDLLRSSAKNLSEHRYVVEHIVTVLEGFGANVTSAPDIPEVVSTHELWHLGTPIEAELDDLDITALDLARALHPTPAIAGTPSREAVDYILSHEENRRFYAGAVGWCRSDGDGMYMVSIRCGETEPTEHSLLMWAGGGIVADSDLDAEVSETIAKMSTLRRVVGIPDDA